MFSEESVPLFGPALPCPPMFTDHNEFGEFLLVKRKYFNIPLLVLYTSICHMSSLTPNKYDKRLDNPHGLVTK